MEEDLFSSHDSTYSLPFHYHPTRARHFEADRIFLAKGSLVTAERKKFVEGICALYPEAEVIECPDTPHNRIDLKEKDPLALSRKGKRTLVFGEHQSAVRFAEEEGNTCPNYWHFSPYGYCFYGCKYCYLAGTPGVWHSPTVKIYVNLDEILREMDRVARGLKQPTAFYLGKLQDGLALDPLTAYSTVLVPFFARSEFARQVILTKSAEVDRLLKLDHGGHTILSWSVNPPEIISGFEETTPCLEERIQAMKKCSAQGYPVRAVLMPMIPAPDWEDIHARFLRRLLSEVNLERLTLGGICIYQNAKRLMEKKLGARNPVSANMVNEVKGDDGRVRYRTELRVQLYAQAVRIARAVKPDLEIALCLEEPAVWEALDLEPARGRCNCVL
jgi:spore photoproduct lyase